MIANKLHNIKEAPQLVSATTQLKLTVADGKGKTKNYALLQNALTDKIHDREMFMKGVDYSYYYEETERRFKLLMRH